MKKVYKLLMKYFSVLGIILLLGVASNAIAQPVVDAGTNATICQDSTFVLSAATASGNGALTYLWTTSGQGNFSQNTILNPDYNCAGTDLNGGPITLTLTVTDLDGSTSDNISILIMAFPTVNAGGNATICEDGSHYIDDATITGDYEAFVWAGGDGTFDLPSTMPTTYYPGDDDEDNGEVELTLFVAPQDPCTALLSDKLKITILPGLTVDAGAPADICAGESYTLSGTGSSGATYAWTGGNGLWAGETTLTPTYTPDVSEYGTTVTLTLEVDNSACASVSDDMELTVNALPAMTCPSFGPYCIDAAAVSLTGATPAGGTYGGDGVNLAGDVFDPGAAGVGPHTITYEYTDGNGCTNSCTFNIVVNPLPLMDCPSYGPFCVDDASVTLTGATPAGGTYSGTGVNLAGTEFDPGTAGAGTHTITYEYNDPATNCSNSCDFIIVVNALPLMDCPSYGPFCVDETAVTLTGATPAGGIYSGTGVNLAGDEFDPGTAGAGTHTITYEYTDPATNCSNSCDFIIVVNALPLMDCPSYGPFCVDEAAVTLTGATPAGGTYYGTGVNLAGTEFDPGTAGDGTHIITYEFTDGNGCTNSCTFNIVVNPLPLMDCPSYGPFCVDEAAVALTGATPAGGTYSGSGVNLAGDEFDPATAGAGTHIITYEYTNPSTLCKNSCTFNIEVNPLPGMTCPSFGPYCEDDAAVTLIGGLPDGGTYSGNGVNLAGDEFDPATAGAGTHIITYEYTDGNGCTNSCTFNIEVNALPQVNCPITNVPSYCIDDPAVALSGATPTGGTYSGDGVNLAGEFNPADAGVGPHTIKYTYTDPATNCSNSCNFTIVVNALPQVDCPADTSICENSAAFVLTGATPAGGEYIGSGVSGGMFDPIAAGGVGSYAITYNYTNPSTNCENSCTFNITVAPLPTVDAGVNFTVCELDSIQFNAIITNDSLIQWAAPAGTGGFNNENIANPVYYPTQLDYAQDSVTFYINVAPLSPCSNGAYDDVTVYFQALPEAIAGNDAAICEDDTYELDGDITNACTNPLSTTTSLWTTAGNGTFNDSTLLDAEYFPGSADIATGSVVLTLTAFPCAPCVNPNSDMMTLSFDRNPTVDILFDDTLVCENTVFNFAGLVNYTDKNLIIWAPVTGGGTFDDGSVEYPNYYPGGNDASSGTIQITVQTTANSPCSVFALDSCNISFQLAPIVKAGNDTVVCEIGSVNLAGASQSYTDGVLWTDEYGEGGFDNTALVNPTYTPTSSAVSNGSVILTITGAPVNPCASSVKDSLELSIQLLPASIAGSDTTICENDSLTLNGNVVNNCGASLWISSGNGIFDDATSLTAEYAPGAIDLVAGSVELSLVAYACTPCADNDTSSFVLSFHPLPIVDAGADAVACESGFALLTATAYNYTTVLWETNGDGHFGGDSTDLNPTYYPAGADIASTVTLIVTVQPESPCTATASDDIILNVFAAPFADAGLDATACETGHTFDISDVQALNYSNLEWTSNGGDGYFDTATILTPTYYPGVGDVNAGIVTLTLVTNPINPCVFSDQDDMDLIIYAQPMADAGSDGIICENGNHKLADATASSYDGLLWTGGAGSFNYPDTLNPTYTPGVSEYGTIKLYLEALPKNPCALSHTDSMNLFIQALPTAIIDRTDTTLCHSGGVVLGTATDADSTLWTTAGDGTFNNPTALFDTYTPGPNDKIAGTVSLTFTAYPVGPCLASASDEVIYILQPGATANAGPDKHICENRKLALLSATASNYSSVLWTSTNGGTFNDAFALNPVYTPDSTDIADGSVELTLTAYDENPCTGSISDNMMLTFQLLPVAYAGPNDTLCEDAIVLDSATMKNEASILWTTSGDGTFSYPDSLNPQYFPGTGDVSFGQVTLTISGTPVGPCNLSDGDDVVIHIIPNALVNAGADDVVCEGPVTDYALAGASASGFASILWTSTGDGSFSDSTAVNPVYTFGATDPGTTVTLCIEAQPNSPCITVAKHCMDLYIQKLPKVFAGDNKFTCGVDALVLADALVSDASAIKWGSSGDGTFSDTTAQNPTYYPGSADSLNQFVFLTVAAKPIAPCSVLPLISDQVKVTIQWPPIANAGSNAEICENQTHTLNGVLTNSTAGYWTTTGDGAFDDTASMTAIYTPGVNDKAAETVDLCLIAEPTLPCLVNSDPDCMTLTIKPLSSADAGLDGVVCQNGTYTVGGGDATVTNASGQLWSTVGDGNLTNSGTLTPSYTPGYNDSINGFVDLCLVGLPAAPCLVSGPSDCMTLTIQMNPIAHAGSDAITCDGVDYQISGASAQYQSAIKWTSTGDGTFVDSTDMNPLYQLGPADVGNNTITFTMAVRGKSPCQMNIVTDEMTLTIDPQPAVIFAENTNPFYGGANLRYCFDENIEVTLYQVLSGVAPFNFKWTIDDGTNPPVADSASGINLNGVLFSDTYAPGSYTVNLTSMVDGNGCSPSDLTPYEMNFTVTTEPIISFGFNTVEANSGDTFTYCAGTPLVVDFMNVYGGTAPFSGSYSVTGASSWDDTFANISSGYQFYTGTLAPGTYDIVMTSLVDVDGCAADSATLAFMHGTVIIKPEPAVLFAFNGDDVATGDTLSYCYNDTIVSTLSTVLEGVAPFTITVEENGTPTTYSGVSAGFEFFKGIKTPGTYNIDVTQIEDSLGCSVLNPENIYNLTINVNPEPELVFSFNGVIAAAGDTLNYCETENITVILNNAPAGTGPFTIVWELDGSAQAPVTVGVGGTAFYMPAAMVYPGSYSIVAMFVIDDNGCQVSDPETKYYATVNIQAAPVPNAGPDAATCANVPYQLSGTAANSNSVSWTTSGTGTFLNQSSLTATYYPSVADLNLPAGEVTLSLAASAISPCLGVISDGMTLSFNDEPAVIFAENTNPFYGGADLQYCFDENIEVTLYQVLSGLEPFDFKWTIDDGTNPPVADSASGINLNGVLFSDTYAPGSYTVNLTSMVDGNGCSPSDLTPYEMNFTVNPQPNPQFTIDGDQVLPGEQYPYCYDVSSIILEIVADFGGTPTIGDAPFDVSFTATGLPAEVVLTDVNFGDNIDILSYYSPLPGPGTYTIQVTKFEDANGCAISTSVLNNYYYFDIVIDTEPTVAITLDGFAPAASTEYCYNDTLDICITGVGGTGPWTATWLATGPGVSFGDVMTGTSECWNFNAIDFIPGTYDLTLVSLVDSSGCEASQTTLSTYDFSIQINPAPLAPTANDTEVCYDGATHTATATAPSGSSVVYYDAPTGGNVSTAPEASAVGVYEAYAESVDDVTGCVSASRTKVTLTITPQPTAYAGGDAAICQGDFYTLSDALATNGASIIWYSPVGVGTFVNSGEQNPTYYPSPLDFAFGSIDLYMSVAPINPCSNGATDFMTLTFQAPPVAYAGENDTICEGDDFVPILATADNASSVSWSTNGQGSFIGQTSLNPTYTPQGTDIGGSVLLCLTAQPELPCLLSSTECISLTVQSAVDAYAGEDDVVCVNGTFPLGLATAANSASVSWSSNGDGSFDNPAFLNTFYTPDGNDAGNVVTLYILAQPLSPCSATAIDSLELFVQGLPTVYAGGDATINSGDTYTLPATATNYSTILWTNGTGDGTFDLPTDLKPVYTPGTQDKIDGEVLLTITVEAIDPCSGSQWSNMALYIEGEPPVVEITSPADGAYFTAVPITVEGTASDPDNDLDFVEVRVNGGAWLMATGTNTWTIEVLLAPCLNTIEARATDEQGLMSPIDIVVDIELEGQELVINPGWSFISSYIVPTYPNLMDLADYITPANSLSIMIATSPYGIFQPAIPNNSIGNWDTQRGYKVKGNNAATWLIAGERTTDQIADVPKGVSYLPVLTNQIVNVEDVFNADDVLIVFELPSGKVWFPNGNLQTLFDLVPGYAYMCNMKNATTVEYPEYVPCDAKASIPMMSAPLNESPWHINRTSNVHLISIADAAIEKLDKPSFIGAFDSDGNCIGYADLRDKADNYLLTIYGDELSTEARDGALDGQHINLIAFNGTEESIEAKYSMTMPNYNGSFTTNGVSMIVDFTETVTGIGGTSDLAQKVSVFPNPASDVVNIYYPLSDGSVNVTFTNASGSMVMQQALQTEESQIDISNLQPGVYVVKFENKGSVVIKRLVIK